MLNYNVLYLFNILNNSIHMKEMQKPLNDVDWKVIGDIAIDNSVLPILYSGIKRLPQEVMPPEDILDRWKNVSFTLSFQQMVSVNELKRVLDAAEKRNIHIILFKGAALAQLYPNCYERKSCDFDLLVKREDADELRNMFDELGFVGHEQKENVQVYTYQGKIKLEIHYSLYEDFEGEKIDLLNRMNLADSDKCIEITYNNMKFKTLGYEEHLIYQFFHMIKHFSFEGINLRYLLDITLYVDKYEKNIDWIHFWNRMAELKYEKFARVVFEAANKYFGMQTLFSEEKKNRVSNDRLELFIEEALNKRDEEHLKYGTIRMLTPYLYNGSEIKTQSNLKIKLSMMFPKAENLPDRYIYAKNCKILLPIAWGERMIRHLYWVYVKKESENAAYKVDSATQKIRLLQELGLMGE